MVKRGLRAIPYVLFLTLFAFGALETAFRRGWVPNAAYSMKMRAGADHGEMKVLVLGHSFSVEDPTPFSLRIGKNPEASRVEILSVPGGAWLEHSYPLRHLAVIKRGRDLKNNFDRLKKTMTAPPSASSGPPPSAPPAPPPSSPSDTPAPPMTPMNPERSAAVLREIAAYAKSQHARLVSNIFLSTLQVNDSRYSFYESVGFTMDRRFLSSTIPRRT